MPEWLVVSVIGAVVTAVLTVILTAWGTAIEHWFEGLYAAIFRGATLARNAQADEEYRRTMMATVEALKERITLLEKWRGEAQLLEARVADLEAEIADLKKQGREKDDRLDQARRELEQARTELTLKQHSIEALSGALSDEKGMVEVLQQQVTEAIAIQADNNVKIGALLHHASGGSGEA